MVSSNERPVNGRPAAALLAACALLAIFAISHHPVVHQADPAKALQAMANIGFADRFMHGTVLVLFLAITYAVLVHTARRGTTRQLAIAAAAVFCVGVGAVTGAALIDGFFVSAFAERIVAQHAGAAPGVAVVMLSSAIAIQVLTKFAIVAMSLGMALWSLDLATDRTDRTAQYIGIAGAMVTVGVLVLLATAGTLRPQNLTLIVAAQAAWYLGLAYVLNDRI